MLISHIDLFTLNFNSIRIYPHLIPFSTIFISIPLKLNPITPVLKISSIMTLERFVGYENKSIISSSDILLIKASPS